MLGKRALVVLPRLSGLRVAGRRVSIGLGCVVLPAILLATFFSVAFVPPPENRVLEPAFGFDFRATWRAAGDVLERESPYPPPTRAALDGEDQYVYPPTPAVAAIPLRLLPFRAAALVFGLLLALSTVLTLRALGVSDWRCYGLVFAWLPVLASIRLGAISILLTFLVALAWRYRDHAYLAVVVVAAVVAAKIFLWPLVVWLAVTGRARQAAAAVAAAASVTVGSWALIGFGGLSHYPDLLRTLSDLLGPKSYSLFALGHALDVSGGAARAVSFAAGGLALAAVVIYGRRRTPAADAHALVLAIAAALALSPIVWTHYFALLLVPIAIARPRLGPLWMLPLLFWLSPDQSDGELWRICLGVGVAVAVVAVAVGVRPVRFPRLRRPAFESAGRA